MSRPVLIGLVSLFLVVSIVGVGGTVLAVDSTDRTAPVLTVGDTSHTLDRQYALEDEETTDFDTESFEVTVHENGDATWTFRYEKRLGDDEAVDSFEEFAEEFEEEETELSEQFETQATALASTGSDRTDREMEATDFERSAGVEPELNHHMGYVELSFTWTEFASTDDETVAVGDVFEGGLYLGSGQTFVLEAGDGLSFQTIDPQDGQYTAMSLENASSVYWTGERNFHDKQPHAVLEVDGAGGPDVGSPSNGDWSVPWVAVAGAALVVFAIGGGVAWYRSRSGGDRMGEAPVAATETPSSGDAPKDGPAPLPDEELMTDEDRVISLIRENGGRMKQVHIVEETGWSKSKVSMLLSDMEEEGTISKLRVGRENIISLDGYEPEATKSPFEE
ncbi:helix-turn-helix transcriptional regulator [Natrialbaceae archaeon A-gly3]